MINFTLSEKQEEQFKEFEKKCLGILLQKQIKVHKNTDEEKKYKILTIDWTVPYTGSIGGGITFHFTPTSLGTVIKVSCSYADIEEIDLTDYEAW